VPCELHFPAGDPGTRRWACFCVSVLAVEFRFRERPGANGLGDGPAEVGSAYCWLPLVEHDVSTGQSRFPEHNGLPRRGLPG
jgi:hypothetical protein